MNQVTEETVQNVKCSQNCQKTTNTKNINSNKKAKDPSEPTELSISSEEQLKQSLVNKLHINNINSSLTNGTSEHLSVSPTKECCDNPEALTKSLRAAVSDVNSVQCRENESNGQNELSPESCESRCALKEVLQTVKNLADNEEQNTQGEIKIISYESELQMPEIMRLIQKDLSEPYSIYTYRYFIHNWPKLCFLATHEGKCIGAIVCKLDMHRNVKRGYIAMLAVDEKYRKRNIGSNLVRRAIQVMIDDNADEVVLETEITNKPALKLYENLGFVRDKRLFRYYLNGVDALRLKLWLR